MDGIGSLFAVSLGYSFATPKRLNRDPSINVTFWGNLSFYEWWKIEYVSGSYMWYKLCLTWKRIDNMRRKLILKCDVPFRTWKYIESLSTLIYRDANNLNGLTAKRSYNTIQYNTIQCNAMQYNTIQYAFQSVEINKWHYLVSSYCPTTSPFNWLWHDLHFS